MTNPPSEPQQYSVAPTSPSGSEASVEGTLTQEQVAAIQVEENILAEVLLSLENQRSHQLRRLQVENVRSRELTSSLVATRRDEEKQLIASDEAVSHALKEKARVEIATIDQMLKRPYFARIRLEEENPRGGIKETEYKIGFHANPDCRIIDWRKAPLSKLYYQYTEGEEFVEEIQGRERAGVVALRNRLDIEEGELTRITCHLGNFARSGGTWKLVGTTRARVSSSYNRLPDILSLITAEQFQSITEDADTAVLVQGIAGSGKTSIALHRLSWLMHEGNRSLSPKEMAIVVVSPALRAYLENSLPLLQLSAVPVDTFSKWCVSCMRHSPIAPNSPLLMARMAAPATVARLKSSFALLCAFEDALSQERTSHEKPRDPEHLFALYVDTMRHVLSFPDAILERDETRLIDRESLQTLKSHLDHQAEEGTVEQSDLPLMLRAEQIIYGNQLLPSGFSGKFSHLVVDEVQDLSPPQLACVVGAVKETADLTLVGDAAQAIDHTSEFPGWDRLRQHWNFEAESSRYITLEVSHRSTAPIMAFATAVSTGDLTAARGVKGRAGRTPIWFRACREQQGLRAAIEWLRKALDRYPLALTAVLCRTRQEAKYAAGLLKPTFGETLRLSDPGSFSLEEGILVAAVKEVKGLEFCNVLIWNPSTSSYGDATTERNLLYVAATRAEENLALATWQRPSPLIPSPQSRLLRYVPLGFDDDDE